MGASTKISWTDRTFNPWWGCQRVSPGCENCYAEKFAKRTGHDVWGPTTERRFFGDAHWREPVRWNQQADSFDHRQRVFCASMADVFEDRPDLDEPRQRLYDLILATPNLDWLLLTKRPGNVTALVPSEWQSGWPANIWLGTTTEDQYYAELRLAELIRIPARVRFVSAEPLLGPIDYDRWFWSRVPRHLASPEALDSGAQEIVQRSGDIHWVITGGESGAGRRPFDPRWASSIRKQCQEAGVAYFHKQGGDLYPGKHTELDGREWHDFPVSAGELKGATS